jgi:hypothetical protein
MEKQLSIWIDGELKDALIERARQEKISLKHLVEDILRQSMAHYRGEVIERQAFPVIREVIRRELRKVFAQLLTAMREDVNPRMVEQMTAVTQRHHDHMAALVSRHGTINHRLLYALLSQTCGEILAHDIHEQALQWSQTASAEVELLQPFPGFEGNVRNTDAMKNKRGTEKRVGEG